MFAYVPIAYMSSFETGGSRLGYAIRGFWGIAGLGWFYLVASLSNTHG